MTMLDEQAIVLQGTPQHADRGAHAGAESAEAESSSLSELLRVTLATVHDAVLITDEAGRVASLNPVAQELTGWSDEEARGRPLAEVYRVVDGDTREPLDGDGKAAMQRENTLLIARDGHETPIADSSSVVRDHSGGTHGSVIVFRSISERGQAEAALRRSERELAESFEDATIGMHWVGPDGTILRVNRAELQMLGYTRDEFLGHHIAEFHLDADVIEDILKRLREGQELRGHEARMRCKDGSAKLVAIDSNVHWEEGEFIHTQCFTRDISDRTQVEETRSRLAAIVESSQDAIIAKSLTGQILAWNAGAERLLGYTADEIIGKPVMVLVPADHQHEEEGIMARLQHGERIEELETLRVAKDGRQIEVSLTVSPIRGHAGQLIGASSIARDITARRQAEETNAQLLEALRDADRRKDEFLAMLAHELRNPLAPIRNAVHILRAKGPPVPDLQWARDVIDRQAEQMSRLVDDLLDVSRITRGKIELRRERIELAAAVKSAVEATRPLFEKWGHELTVSIPEHPVYLDADFTRLSQVLLNLLNNAAKYTEQPGHISLSGAEEGGQVVIRVKDNGIGIPPDQLSRVFDMFTQLDRSLDRSQGGLGLGLTLVLQLIRMHGGSVEARSEGLGKGSEFIVRLPRWTTTHGDGVAGDSGTALQPALPRYRILVVDDNKDAADSLGMVLRMLGSDVLTAHDGLEAVGAAAVFRPQIILMDLGLPRLSGYEAARRIRAEQGGEVILIAVTGWGQEDDRRRSELAGFDYHLTKPVPFEKLQTLLAERLPGFAGTLKR